LAPEGDSGLFFQEGGQGHGNGTDPDIINIDDITDDLSLVEDDDDICFILLYLSLNYLMSG
jgi:hypothetical protein